MQFEPPKAGHNQPPSLIDFSTETVTEISSWLTDHPAIETEEDSRAAKGLYDRLNNLIKDIEGERDSRVRPLNAQVRAINDEYREPKNAVTITLGLIQQRLGDYAYKVEQERIRVLEEARQKAEEAERAAREAEERERDAINSAKVGECVDAVAATVAADIAFSAYKAARRQEALAERDARVKIGGGFQRALGFKKTEVIEVQDPIAAITDMGVSPEINEAIAKAAKAYRKVTGELPAGVVSTYTRSLR